MKALYGLNQAPIAWYERLSEFLINNGYNRGRIDKTLFVKNDSPNLCGWHSFLWDVRHDDAVFYSTNAIWVWGEYCRINHLFSWSSSKANGKQYFCVLESMLRA